MLLPSLIILPKGENMKKKNVALFVSIMIVALLSVASWQAASAASSGPEVEREIDESGGWESPNADGINCSRELNYVPNAAGTDCVLQCPEGQHLVWGGTCKEEDPGDEEKNGAKPYSSAIFGNDQFQNMEQSRQTTSEGVLYTISGWFTVAALAVSMVIARPKSGKKTG